MATDIVFMQSEAICYILYINYYLLKNIALNVIYLFHTRGHVAVKDGSKANTEFTSSCVVPGSIHVYKCVFLN